MRTTSQLPKFIHTQKSINLPLERSTLGVLYLLAIYILHIHSLIFGFVDGQYILQIFDHRFCNGQWSSGRKMLPSPPSRNKKNDAKLNLRFNSIKTSQPFFNFFFCLFSLTFFVTPFLHTHTTHSHTRHRCDDTKQTGCACRFLYGPETKDDHKTQIEKSLDGKIELKLEVIFYKKSGKLSIQYVPHARPGKYKIIMRALFMRIQMTVG